MADSVQEIILESPDATFPPGATIRGHVDVRAESGWVAEYFELALLWQTSGRGDRDEGIVGGVMLAAKGDQVPAHFQREFSLVLPFTPVTYDGHHVKIAWYLRLAQQRRGGSEQTLETTIFVRSRPPVAAPAVELKGEAARSLIDQILPTDAPPE